ncbi:MAG: hypothetical protein JO267_13795 [Alphaproteobacteria bacterium]|nr:hypothetical protein [Alphaproteobacteria bacterium]
MKMETQGRLTTLTDSGPAFYVTRSALMGWAVLSMCAGAFQAWSFWRATQLLSNGLLICLFIMFQAPLCAGASLAMSRTTVVIDAQRREICLRRQGLMRKIQSCYPFDDILDVEPALSSDDNAAFVCLRLRSGEGIRVCHLGQSNEAAAADAAAISAALQRG